MTIAQRNLLAQGNRDDPYPYVGASAFIKVVGIDSANPNTFFFVYPFNGQLFQAQGRLHNTSILADPTEDGSVTAAARQAAHDKMCGKGIFLFALNKGRDGQERYLLEVYHTDQGWPLGGLEGKTDPSVNDTLKSEGHLNSFAHPAPRSGTSHPYRGARGSYRGSRGSRGRGSYHYYRGHRYRGSRGGSFHGSRGGRGSFRGPRGHPSHPVPMTTTMSPMSPSMGGSMPPSMAPPLPPSMPHADGTVAPHYDETGNQTVHPTAYMTYMGGMVPMPYSYPRGSDPPTTGYPPRPSL